VEAKLKNQAVKFNKSRNNLLAVVAFTAINLILIAFDAEFHFLFSAIIPQVVQYALYDYIGMEMIGALSVALAITSIFLICYALSKRWRFFILVALILFAVDAAFLVLEMVYSGDFVGFSLYVIFHTWILFYLITGTIAWIKLRNVTPGELAAIQTEVTQEADAKELNSAIDTVSHGVNNEQGLNEEQKEQDSNE